MTKSRRFTDISFCFVHLISNWRYVFIPKLDKLLETAYGTKLPSMIELQEKTAIAFVSTTTIFDLPQPLPENVIPVGGVHIREPKPLPKVKFNTLSDLNGM